MSGFSVFLPDSDEQGYPDADMQCEELHDLPPEVEQEFQDIRSVGRSVSVGCTRRWSCFGDIGTHRPHGI
jgi:hypothetical protein